MSVISLHAQPKGVRPDIPTHWLATSARLVGRVLSLVSGVINSNAQAEAHKPSVKPSRVSSRSRRQSPNQSFRVRVFLCSDVAAARLRVQIEPTDLVRYFKRGLIVGFVGRKVNDERVWVFFSLRSNELRVFRLGISKARLNSSHSHSGGFHSESGRWDGCVLPLRDAGM